MMTVAGQDDAIEAIKQLKARYFRLMDTKQWDAYRQVFTDDMAFYFESEDAPTATSGDDFVAYVRSRLATALSVHQGHTPEIELTSATTARGVWALQDVVRFGPGLSLVGYGHYHETYENIAGQWLIKSSKLTRLREDIVTPVFSFYISDRIRRTAAKLAGRLLG